VAKGRPVAAIVVTPDAVYVEPVVDATKIALAGLTTGAFIIYWLFRLLRSTASDDDNPSLRDVREAIQGD
jgi:hypothetical protein